MIGGVGEFNLIARLTSNLASGAGIALGIGDDAAVLAPRPGHHIVATIDGQVEGVHFRRALSPAHAVGYRSIVTNLSDLAAMGADPRWVLVALTLPADLEVAWIDEAYRGIGDALARFGGAIVGGNVSRSGRDIVIDVTALGEVPAGKALTRAGARPGDAIVVTGSPGRSAAGLALLLDPSTAGIPAPTRQRLIEAHFYPTPRVAIGKSLGETGIATSAIDISDGLSADLGHILAASGVGATLELDSLPADDDVATFASAVGRDPIDLTLTGGEAYELLFTCRPADVGRALALVHDTGVSARSIGVIDDTNGLTARGNIGHARRLGGHDHFGVRGME